MSIKAKSPEFLTEIWSQAKASLPGWLYASLLQASRSRAGGLAAHRIDEPDIIAKIALAEIKPERLKELSDEDLSAVWDRLGQWYSNAKRRKQAIELFVNAGVWTKAELERRGKEIDLESTFVQEIEQLESGKSEVKKESAEAMGPDGATLAFVGASPSKMDAARREPLTGAVGEVFNKLYLEPLHMDRSNVLLLNAVPELLLDDKGKAREPNDEELAKWTPWLNEQLDKKAPQKIIALGRTAEKALAGRAALMLPHPAAVLRFGDSGEVARKLKRIEKAKEDEEYWAEHWHEMFPKSGKGRFVFQHHWRGLEEDETKLDEENLLKTDHSLHGDLRFEGDESLWGFTVFLGETKDNREERSLNGLQVTPKPEQPNEWLEVGEKEPYISKPGEVGATSEKYSKFFKIDGGTYQLGMAREHGIEIFLDGGKLKGRYLFLYAPISGRRLWLIEKPEDEKPFAESRDLADVLRELKQKKQQYLIWSKPGERPQKIDVNTGSVVKEAVRIAKADTEKQIVYGVVLDPYGESGPSPDAHNDWMPPAEIEKTAHDFLQNSRTINLQHKGKANAQVVESWVEPYGNVREYRKAMRGEAHKVVRREFGTDVLHSGAWVLGVKLGDKEWRLFLDKKINAFSPGGMGVRTPIERRQMPSIEFVDLVEKR